MTQTIFIDGAVGTTGLEIRERLETRREFRLMFLDEERRKDKAARREALNDADFAILCLPDDAAREAAAMVTSATRIIDASSAHRVAEGWTYGFPELNSAQREKIASAQFVSNPGCYPTGFLALVAPLVAQGLLPADWPYSVHAVSGYSGGGKTLIERFEGEGTDIAFRAYGLDLGHKHIPEMQKHAGLAHPPVFAPSVVHAYRGMLAEIPLPIGAMKGAASPEKCCAALMQHYSGSPFVKVHDETPAELLVKQGTPPRDGLDLYVSASADGEQARLIATLDNLGKGASGAAVQNLNIMAGLEETAGLRR